MNRSSLFGRWMLAAAIATLTACSTPGAPRTTAAITPVTTPLIPVGWPEHPGGDTLWNLVNGNAGKGITGCVPSQQAGETPPKPCADVSIGGGVASGYAVLKDRKGIGQYLVMPTQLIIGIEDTKLRAPGATNYFDPAWRVRALSIALVEKAYPGIKLTRDDMSIAVNSFGGRSQDLLHLHVDCLDLGVRDALHAQLATIGRKWSAQPLTLMGHPYYALRIDGDDTVKVDPFDVLQRGLKVPAGEMGLWTMVLAGATYTDGPGFVLLASRADPANKWDASGEELQGWNHDCSGRTPAAP